MSENLPKITGPECPICGCEDSEVVKTTVRWGQPTTRRACANCGQVWTVAIARPQQASATPPRKGQSDEQKLGAIILRQFQRTIQGGKGNP
jgi:uncharacterized Zn finger protein